MFRMLLTIYIKHRDQKTTYLHMYKFVHKYISSGRIHTKPAMVFICGERYGVGGELGVVKGGFNFFLLFMLEFLLKCFQV